MWPPFAHLFNKVEFNSDNTFQCFILKITRTYWTDIDRKGSEGSVPNVSKQD